LAEDGNVIYEADNIVAAISHASYVKFFEKRNNVLLSKRVKIID